MNPDIKARWVAALRSGYYKQGKYKMRDLGDFYDPIGVLCDLAVREDVIDPPKRYDDEDGVFFGYVYGEDNAASFIPDKVSEWSELDHYRAHRVAVMSDEGMKFEDLAKWIEKNL